MQHADQKYINALVNNETILLNELYQKYSPKIKQLVIQNNGSETDAADIFQEVLLWIYKKAKNDGFILTCPLEAFLYIACKNRWSSELKRRKINKVTIDVVSGYSIDKDNNRLIEEFQLQQERNQLLTDKLAQLCEDCRKLLQLSWSGESMETVAGILNMTYGYARKKKSECMAQLVMLVKQSSLFNSLKW